MRDPKADEMVVGVHEFRFVPPRRAIFVMRQVLEEEHVIAYMEFIDAHVSRNNGPLDALFDVSALTGVTPSARAKLVTGKRDLPYARVAIVGASFSIRTIVNMLLRAGKIVSPKKFSFAFKFVDSVDEANTWFDESPNKRG